MSQQSDAITEAQRLFAANQKLPNMAGMEAQKRAAMEAEYARLQREREQRERDKKRW